MKWADREIIGLLQQISTIQGGGGGGGGGVGLNTAQTNVTWTVNTSGISLNAGGYAGTNTAITGGSLTVNTSGVSLNLPAYLTTARASTDAVGLNTAQTNVTWTVNSSGISINAGGYAGTNTAITGGSVTLNTSGISINLPAYLTTARASTDAVGLNTAQTNVTWTVNSSGISINAGAYAGTVTGATNCSVTANTSGISVSVPATQPAPATLSFFQNVNIGLASNTAASQFTGSSAIVFPFELPNYISASYIRFLGSFAIVSTSFATSAAPTSTSALAANTLFAVIYTQGTGANSRSLQYITSASAGMSWQVSITESGATNNWTLSQAITYPLEGANTANTAWNYASTLSTINVSTTDATQSNFTGPRVLDLPFATSLSPGNYWMAVIGSTAQTGAAGWKINSSIHGVNQINQNFDKFNLATNSSDCLAPGLGLWSTNSNGTTTSSIALANLSTSTSNWRPYFQFIRQA